MRSTALDDTDFRIINALVANGRASFASLGEAVGLSPHGAADRVRRLERAGVITGYSASVALEEVGRDFGVTRERVRQIEAKAIRKLHSRKCLALLNGLIE